MVDVKEPWEAYALVVLNSVLGEGDSSRLTSRVVREQQLAVSAGSSYDAFRRLSGLLELEAIPQACLRPRDRFWDIPVPKIDSDVDNLFVPQPSWSPSTTQQLRKLVAAP